MRFGQWVRQRRKGQGLSVQALGHRAHVDAATISRIENEHTEATFDTALAISEALGLPLAELVGDLHKRKKLDWVEPSPSKRDAARVLTLKDVKAFHQLWEAEPARGRQVLADLMNTFAKRYYGSQRMGWTVHYSAPDIDKLQRPPPLYDVRLVYPPDLGPETLLQIYLRGGMLTLADVGSYVQKRRMAKKVSQEKLEKSSDLAVGALTRLETGGMLQIKLKDVLNVDRALGEAGEILGMYRVAFQFELYRFGIRAADLSHSQNFQADAFDFTWFDLLIMTCRWCQSLAWEKPDWLDSLRAQLALGKSSD